MQLNRNATKAILNDGRVVPVVNSQRSLVLSPPTIEHILAGVMDDPAKCTLARATREHPLVLDSVVGNDRVYHHYADNTGEVERHPFPRNMKDVKQLNDVEIRSPGIARALAESVSGEVVHLEPFPTPGCPTPDWRSKGKVNVPKGQPKKPRARRRSPDRRTRKLLGLR